MMAHEVKRVRGRAKDAQFRVGGVGTDDVMRAEVQSDHAEQEGEGGWRRPRNAHLCVCVYIYIYIYK